MPDEKNRLARLIAFANEPSSERRRELLREVSDLFFEAPERYGDTERGHFGAIMSKVAFEMEMEVRQHLAGRLAALKLAPRNLVLELAKDEIAVAEPLLKASPVLTDADLVDMAHRQSQEHLLAIAQRERIGTGLADALVAKGDDAVVESLMLNAGASISRKSFEEVVRRAEKNERLHGPVVTRKDLPADLMNDLFFAVSAGLKQFILERNAGIDEQALDEAIAETRRKVTGACTGEEEIPEEAVAFIDRKERARELTEGLLVQLLRNKQTNEFLAGFARIAGLDHLTARRVMQDRSCEGIAIACKAARFARTTFSTIVLLANPSAARKIEETCELLDLYDKVPAEAAQRTMRFWKVRRNLMNEQRAA